MPPIVSRLDNRLEVPQRLIEVLSTYPQAQEAYREYMKTGNHDYLRITAYTLIDDNISGSDLKLFFELSGIGHEQVEAIYRYIQEEGQFPNLDQNEDLKTELSDICSKFITEFIRKGSFSYNMVPESIRKLFRRIFGGKSTQSNQVT